MWREPRWRGDLEQVEMAGEVGADIVARMLDRMAHAGLGAEMDDIVEVGPGQRLVQPLMVGEIDLEEAECAGAELAQLGEPVRFQPGVVISVEIVDADHPVAALEQPPGDVVADEAGDAGDECRGHGTHRSRSAGSSVSRQMPWRSASKALGAASAATFSGPSSRYGLWGTAARMTS